MRLKKILSVFLLAVFCLSAAATGVQAAELFKLPTAWIDRHETFLIWYAKERGWDREEGLDIDIQYFASGKDIVDALPSKAWVFAGMGDVSAMNASVHYGTSIIAVANDEGMTSAVLGTHQGQDLPLHFPDILQLRTELLAPCLRPEKVRCHHQQHGSDSGPGQL